MSRLRMITSQSFGLHGQFSVLPSFHRATAISLPRHFTTQRVSSSSSSGTRSSTPEQQQTSDASGGMALNEDMLAQLRAAQEEAARLKRELAQLQQQGSSDVVDSMPQRIDSTDNRELPWAPGKRTAWLSEADVDFFTGGGATEAADTAGASPEAQATVSKRLLIGGAATLGLVAFAMVPTKELRLKPQKPLYFYVVQLLSAQAQLSQIGLLIEDAQWDNLRLILPRIRGSPTNAESALYDVVALLDAPVAAKAEPLAAEFLEYLDAMDYNKYFDAMPVRTISGTQNAEFVKFSKAALKAAQGRLAAFLALVPPGDLAAAQQQADAQGAAE